MNKNSTDYLSSFFFIEYIDKHVVSQLAQSMCRLTVIQICFIESEILVDCFVICK